jgi:uncharacterized membrane protein YeaQ/YmgE (transglycosylase-associated protein family)
MSIESLAGMFSQRSGADQSMGSSVMSAIVGFLAQKIMGGAGGMGSMLSGLTGGGGGGVGSILSGLGGLNKDHELVRHVQQNTGIQDPDQARQYTQHGVDILNEQSNNNPDGLQSILGGFLGGGSKQGSGSGIGDMLGI